MNRAIKTTALTCAAILLTMGITTAQAQAATADNSAQSEVAYADISKSEAKNIAKNYLKSKKAYKKLRIGKIVKETDRWKVRFKTTRGAEVLTGYVDDKTGEITFKQ